MNKKIVTVCLLMVLFSVPVLVGLLRHTDILEMERRKISPFPHIPSSLTARHIKSFFHEFEAYYNDRLPGRQSLLHLVSLIYEAETTDLNPGKCYHGKNNWLFLGNDNDRCVDTLTGKWRPSPEELSSQELFFTTIKQTVNACCADFYMLIGPNKSSIYQEYLPPLIFPAETRAIEPLVKKLKADGISVFDATEHLRKNKKEGLLYYRSDTHWNNLGAKLAFEEFLRQTGLAVLPPVELVPQGECKGDLVNIGGYRNFPLSKGDNFLPRWKDDGHKPTIDKTVLVLGDSFSGALMFYLHGVFKNVEYVHYDKVAIRNSDIKNITTYIQNMGKKPDIVLWIQVERIFAHWGNS